MVKLNITGVMDVFVLKSYGARKYSESDAGYFLSLSTGSSQESGKEFMITIIRKYGLIFSTAIIMIFSAAISRSEELIDQDYIMPDTVLRFPVIDAPYNTGDGYTFPSMNQSLMITKDSLQAAHSFVWNVTGSQDRFIKILILCAWDYIFFQLPGGTAWVHEEWHRAVMGQYGISSFNDVYNIDFGAESIAVSHVKDSDLAWLKENHNPDMVRLMAAGNEAEVQLSRFIRRESFFNGRPVLYEIPAMWMSLVNASFYVIYCGTKDADRDTDEFNKKDGDNVKRRDFTGLDFTAWIYDLSRPDELYSSRGIHPSGTGFDRYIKYSDLTDSEKRYLRITGYLTLLNFISPQLFGYEGFIGTDPVTGNGLHWNFMLLHNLTSFGNDVSVNLLMQERGLNLEFALHSYFNKEHFSPGVEAGIHRYPLTIAGERIFCNTGVILFMQPRDQEFITDKREAGAWISAGFDIPLIDDKLEFYVEGDAKTEGWIAGNVYPGKEVQGRAGINYLY